MARSPTENARHSGLEHIDHGPGSGAKNSLSQGRQFRSRDEENSEGGKGRARGGFERGRGSSRSNVVSGANETPLGTRRGNTCWGDGGNSLRSSSWNDVTTNTIAQTGCDVDWSEPASRLPESSNQNTATGVYLTLSACDARTWFI